MSEKKTEEILQEETVEQKPAFKYVISVRFKNSRKAYSFGSNDDTLEYGDYVVVETVRGLEMGEVISDLRDVSLHTQNTPLKPVVRKATRHDRQNYAENKDLAKEAMAKCQAAITQLKLDMNLISCEYTLDRSKIIFVYVADERVDFRELLKELAGMFKCRIELRQIGPRDKAKIIGGLGTCGMETCCSRFMEDFDVVSINMAKNQLLALNIQKLSGQCGKLMCCLKFEDENYKKLRQGLPKMNAQVEYEGKMYRVTSMNVINGTAKIENRENVQFITIEDLMNKGIFRKPEPQNQKGQKQNKDQKPAENTKKNPEKKEQSEKKKPEQKKQSDPAKKNEQKKQNKPVKENKGEKQGKSDKPQEKKNPEKKNHRRPHQNQKKEAPVNNKEMDKK